MKLLLHSPVGLLLAEYDPDALRDIRFWPAGEHPPAGTRDAPARTDSLGTELARQLAEYFAGERRSFDLPLRPAATPFQVAVRYALLQIPYGEVRTYLDVARATGRPGAARAVGQVNAHNPFPIIVPCHRVVAANGALGGYLGEWGRGDALGKKEWLLRHEAGVLSLGL
ncbi:MAG TPA: methylated-DNA--[protein]-cysteine S-methyltransferase [Longimicrobiaceae bacterium]